MNIRWLFGWGRSGNGRNGNGRADDDSGHAGGNGEAAAADEPGSDVVDEAAARFERYAITPEEMPPLKREANERELRIQIGLARKDPLYLPLDAHWEICGGSGTGKSALQARGIAETVKHYPNRYINVIDLGGDRFLYHFCRALCKEHGKPFRDFALSFDTGYRLDPIAACTRNITASERASIVCQACALSHGLSYGPGFHGNVSREEVEQKFEWLEQVGLEPTLENLGKAFAQGKRLRPRDISEAELRCRTLARNPYLTVAADPAKQLTFRTGYELRSLDYYYLPANRDDLVPIITGTMVFAAILNEATTLGEELGELDPCDAFCDEAAWFSGARTFETKLPVIRKWVNVRLAYQYTNQWHEHGRYMQDSLASNCPVRIWLSPTTEEDFRALELASDEEPQGVYSRTIDGLNTHRTIREELRPKLARNGIREVARTDGEGFFFGRARNGDPLRFRITYPTTKAQHDRLSKLPLCPNRPNATSAATPAAKLAVKKLSDEQLKRKAEIQAKLKRTYEETAKKMGLRKK